MPSSTRPASSAPVYANFACEKFTIGAGVAIFHLATERVVVCYHSRDKYWFLPKGRRNASEETGRAAEREGFEESGYRNRLLPLPILHRQPYPDDMPKPTNPFDTEPLWTQLAPQGRTAQYILHWYAAETIPEDAEDALPRSTIAPVPRSISSRVIQPYKAPPAFPADLTLKERIAQDSRITTKGAKSFYEPKKHEGTGVDAEELLYESYLLPIEDARRKLKKSIMEDVVKRAWEAIKTRMQIEEEEEAKGSDAGR